MTLSRTSSSKNPFRVLIFAPTGRDTEVLVQALTRAGIVAEACASIADLCGRMADGAGSAVIAGEILATTERAVLERALDRQPEWSDFPLVIMDTAKGGRNPSAALAHLTDLSYAVVLVRPVHGHTLVSAVRAALRSRSRQYQVRDELAERKRAEKALRESNERKDEFLAMLGHELRNPLAAIRSATELMKLASPKNNHLMRVHGVLDRQSLHMTRLMDGLLEVSRISRGKIHLDREPLDVRLVLEATLQDRIAEIEARGLEVKLDLMAEPVWVLADRSRLTQVFDNLIGNSIKFTDAPGSITVELRESEGHAVLRVVDTGVGIRPQILERLFDPFQQDAQDIARSSGGLGLGLALAKGLVELHGGSIAAQSAGPGTGAEFKVQLPVGAPPDQEKSEEESAEPVPCRILVVEDNTDAGNSLCALLEVLGHSATLVETGSDALEFLQTQGANMVLCDLGLPGMSGYDLAKTLREDASLQEIPLIAVTGYGQPEDQKRAKEAGFDEHLTKPVEVDTLNSVLGRFSTREPRATTPES